MNVPSQSPILSQNVASSPGISLSPSVTLPVPLSGTGPPGQQRHSLSYPYIPSYNPSTALQYPSGTGISQQQQHQAHQQQQQQQQQLNQSQAQQQHSADLAPDRLEGLSLHDTRLEAPLSEHNGAQTTENPTNGHHDVPNGGNIGQASHVPKTENGSFYG